MSRLPDIVQAILASQQHETTEIAARIVDVIIETLRMMQPLPAFGASSHQTTP